MEGNTINKISKIGAESLISGGRIASMIIKGARDVLNNEFGNLSEQCAPEGTDFKSLGSIPTRLEKKMNLCREIAEQLKMQEIPRSLESIIAQIAAPLFKVLFVGRYSVGKSSIINALLDRSILPEGTTPTTGTLTWILQGQDEFIVCENADRTISQFQIDTLKDDKSIEERNLNIFVSVKHQMLSAGVALIDTPGLSDPNEIVTRTTLEALESADAIVFVMDTYTSSRDKEFLSNLSMNGKTKHLFVLINKIDTVPAEERQDFIEERTKILNEIGIAANIFPISTRSRENKGLNKFRDSLVEFMTSGIQESRMSMIDGKVSEVLRTVKHTCESALAVENISEEERGRLMSQMAEDAQKFRGRVSEVERKAIREIEKFEEHVFFNWQRFFRNMQEDIDVQIDKANVSQLKRRDFIESLVVSEAMKFISQEFEPAVMEVENFIRGEIVDFPSSLEVFSKFELGTAKTVSISQVPPQMFTAGLVVLEYMTLGLFGCIPTVVATMFGRSLLEGFWTSSSEHIETISMRKQLRSIIQEQWGTFDGAVRDKIANMCRALKENIKKTLNEKNSFLGQNSALVNLLSEKNETQTSSDKLREWLREIKINGGEENV